MVLFLYKITLSFKNSPITKSHDFTVCIVGAGFSGIGAAIKLKEIGVKFRIIEKDERLGGTWWENQYPGCACDVQSHLYSYSFELNPEWSQSFSPQPEILKYIEKVANKYGITNQIECGKKVLQAVWINAENKWRVELDNGETFKVNAIVDGTGALHVPSIPDFKGKDLFKGDAFHSAQWKKDYDIKDKRVAVIGTGASAVQIVPSIATKAKHLTVFQRTPCWTWSRGQFVYPTWMKYLFKVYPPLMYLLRLYYFWINEFRYSMVFRMNGYLRSKAQKRVTKEIREVVKNPEVAEKLIPKFEVGCKRITPSDTYLASFNKNNVQLETESIIEIAQEGIITNDGVLHKVDTIIYATGFSIIGSCNGLMYYGKNGQQDKNSDHESNEHIQSKKSLKDEWGDFPNAYKGMTYPGIPNVFFLLGPGAGLGHSSVVYMIECQIDYVIDAVRQMIKKNIKSIDIKKESNDNYQSWVQKKMQNKVFNSANCISWYKNKSGVNFALWPSHLTRYWLDTRRINMNKYNCTT